MANQDNTRQNVVKLPTTAVSKTSGKSLVPAKPNISELARQHGVSRQTMRRRLANGWQPGDTPSTPSIEILSPPQRVATMATTHGHPGQHSGSYVAATVLALAALTLGGIQLAIDGQYAGGFGRTPVETA